MTPEQFRAIYGELADENPFAIRAVLKVMAVEFTTAVPTLAVTLEERPRMLVNLEFVAAHCRTEAHVKAVICHEFLHVLLRHTERFDRLDRAEHLALDAVINAVIHRELGPDYSSFMAQYYASERGIGRLLRPALQYSDYYVDPRRARTGRPDPVVAAWQGLYFGRLVADDIADLARDLEKECPGIPVRLIGGHEGESDALDPGAELPSVLREALDRSLKAMNGDGLWRSPKDRGVGTSAYRDSVLAADAGVERWRRQTYAVLKKHLLPDPKAKPVDTQAYEFALPVLSTADRRAALRSLWSPFLPEALWRSERPGRAATAQVYLDVSGSMYAEMPLIVALLTRLSRHIRRPFWAFSDQVAPARIENGRLVSETTGGTSMRCVLEHVAKTKPEAAVVVTDGYIERLTPGDRRLARATRLHAVVTRDGHPGLLYEAGIPYTQLARLPQ